jgi:gas vesicle protein
VQNCREYCGLGFSNGAIYLKYYDGIDYDCTMEEEDGHHKKQCSMVEKSTGQYGYQKIEFLQKIKSSKKTKHKSNMFSVNIKNSGIENICKAYSNSTSTNADDIRNSIKKDIKNAVTKIFENVCPANTQLFQVYFEED